MTVSTEVLEDWIQQGWPHGRPPWTRDAFIQLYQDEQRALADAKAKDWRAQELEALRHANAALSRRIVVLERRTNPAGNPTLKAVVDVLGPIVKRLKALEQRDVMVYRGVFDADSKHDRGDVVTRDGSTWFCTHATKGVPGKSPDWRMISKSGGVI